MPANAVPPLLQHVRRLGIAAASDEQLLTEFIARRSDEAFAALLGRHGPMVLNVCRRILHDPHAAEDVFQATFLVLAGRAAAAVQGPLPYRRLEARWAKPQSQVDGAQDGDRSCPRGPH